MANRNLFSRDAVRIKEAGATAIMEQEGPEVCCPKKLELSLKMQRDVGGTARQV